MKIRIVIFLVLSLASLNVKGQDGPPISCDFQGVGFEEFVSFVEAETGLTFYYRQEWIEEEIEALRTMLEASRNCVFFTGAGISTESGIPDFRSPGGVWL